MEEEHRVLNITKTRGGISAEENIKRVVGWQEPPVKGAGGSVSPFLWPFVVSDEKLAVLVKAWVAAS